AINVINGLWYCRYIYWGPVNISVPQDLAKGLALGGQYNNLGYLYAAKYLGDGHVMFDPSFTSSSPLAPDRYSTPSFLSTDGGGDCRSSYLFNPWVIGGGISPNLRLIEKSSQAVKRKI